MTCSSPYAGQRVALATRHGKQRVIGRALRHGLGAELLHLPQLDTDALGSFCGTVARQGSALDACLAKAELALSHGGTGLAIASEGTFAPHPAVPLLHVGRELMVFLDRDRDLLIREELLARRTNFAGRAVLSADLTAGRPGPELRNWLRAVDFPRHALIVRPQIPQAGSLPVDGGSIPGLRKGILAETELIAALQQAFSVSGQDSVWIETDMRAHCNPTRMASIRRLGFRLVRRIASPCPRCAAPGWGWIDTEPGLPCAWCGTPTSQLRWDLLGCTSCGHRHRQPRPDGLLQADPGQCPRCNP